MSVSKEDDPAPTMGDEHHVIYEVNQTTGTYAKRGIETELTTDVEEEDEDGCEEDQPPPRKAGPMFIPKTNDGKPNRHRLWLAVIPPWEPEMIELFKKKEMFSKMRVLIGLAASTGITLFISLMLGVGLNQEIAGTNGEFSDPYYGEKWNAINICVGSFGVAFAMGLIRWFVKFFCHRRTYGIYAFWVYVLLCVFTFSRIFEPYYSPGNGDAASQAGLQVKRL